MTALKKYLKSVGYHSEEYFGRMKLRLKKRLGLLQPIQIVPYRGYSSGRHAFIKGRVLTDRGILQSSNDDRLWRNMLAAYRRFSSDEIPNAEVTADFMGQHLRTTTDTEGYFSFSFDLENGLEQSGCTSHRVKLNLTDSRYGGKEGYSTDGEILTAGTKSTFGVISDIDDTIVQTHATSFLKMAQLTFMQNARTRLPFDGVAAFYRALQKGVSDDKCNPFFYVSRSPWNLYDFLIDFMKLHDLPDGPLFLRDIGFNRAHVSRSRHKSIQIRHIMNTVTDLPFILIGDSGQKDPEIYLDIAREYPGRVRCIYIRDVTSAERDAEIQQLAGQARDLNVPMRLVRETEAAALDALQNEWVNGTVLDEIRREKDLAE